MKSRAFTVIELIITIALLSLAVFSTQLIIAASSNNDELISDNEIYTKCAVIANDISSRYWDNSNYIADLSGSGYRLCDTNSSNILLSRVGNIRIGDFARGETSRTFYTQITPASNIKQNNINLQNIITNSIESYDGSSFVYNNVKFEITVEYVPESVVLYNNTAYTSWLLTGGIAYKNQSNSTNLKRITITATKNDNSKIRFTLFASNIGEQKLKAK